MLAIYCTVATHTSYSYLEGFLYSLHRQNSHLKLFVSLCRDQKTDQRTELSMAVNMSVVGLLKVCASAQSLTRVQADLEIQEKVTSQSPLAYLGTT